MKGLNTLIMPTFAPGTGLRHLSLLLLLSLGGGSALAGIRHYQAPLAQAQWETSSDEKLCVMTHEIPLYGRATFSQSAGEPLRFTMTVKQPATRNRDKAHLRSLPPAWKHQVNALDMNEVEVQRGMIPFQLEGRLPRRMLAELEKGMLPTFSYRDWVDAQDSITVSLSGININEPLQRFTQCLSKLPVYDFSDFKTVMLHFDPGKDELKKEAQEFLDKMAIYLKSDPAIKKIEVEGHTDNVGRKRFNDNLGERRGKAVRRYLTTKGVPDEKFVIKSYGERKPIETNRTDKGREKNRRVLVNLVK